MSAADVILRQIDEQLVNPSAAWLIDFYLDQLEHARAGICSEPRTVKKSMVA